MAQDVDVVIIGAGISGLTTAYEINQKDPSLSFAVLEAKDRVGGRTYSVELQAANGTDTWDLGGQWVGVCQPHITAMLEELKLKTHPQYAEGRKFLQVGGSKITSYVSSIPSLSGLALLDLHRMISDVEHLRRMIDIRDPYGCPMATDLDSMTLHTFLKQKYWTKGAIECVEVANRTMFGAESSQISALFYLTYVAAAGGIHKLVECDPGSGQESTIQGGAQQISECLKDKIGKDSVLLNHAVKIIDQSDDSVYVTCQNGAKFKTKRIVIATPPCSYGQIEFTPRLPSDKQQLIKRMPICNIIKIIITYKKSFWRSDGNSGEIVTNGGATTVPGCDTGPLSVVYDCTTAKGNAALVAFIGGDQAVQWAQQSAEMRETSVLQSLSECLGEAVWSYIEYREQDWSKEPHIGGGPVSCVTPGGMKYFTRALRHPYKMVHFAGTESATVWCGFMNGAVQAGLRAAHEVLYHLRPQSVSHRDLAATVYGQMTPRQNSGQSSSFTGKILKMTLSIGTIAASIVILRHFLKR